MIVIPGRIPIAIHPLFWAMAAIIGWISTQTFTGCLIWAAIIFFSVLIHEFGHALTAVAFKQKAQIQLIALGGLTSYEGPKLKFFQQFLITLNGPLFGFSLCVLATLILRLDWSTSPTFFYVLKVTQLANLFWAVINLLPVLPLDGGQLLRIALEASFGVKGFKASLLIGAITAALFAFYFFIVHAFLAGALFFLFAFESFDAWRKSRFATPSDREEANTLLISRGENALKEGKKEEAKEIFEQVRKIGKGGLLGAAAAQYLAILLNEEGKHKEAYEVLLPMKNHLPEESLCLLQKLAAREKNYPLVAELSSVCYQALENQEVAVRNARAFAYLKEPKPAGGWLQTAWQHGGLDLEALLQEEEFIAIKNDPEFIEFITLLKKT